MDGIDGLSVGDPVTAEQMRALFGCGLHPLAELRQQQLEGPKIVSAKVTPSRSGHHLEATRTPPSSAKSQSGGPPTASIPKTRDQPEEEANSRQPPPSGNNTSTGISPIPPIHQATTGLTNDRQHTPHLVARTATTGAGTKHPVNVRTGQPHPGANPLSNCCVGGCGSPNAVMSHSHGSHGSRLPNRALSRVKAARCAALRSGARAVVLRCRSRETDRRRWVSGSRWAADGCLETGAGSRQ
jgi:hypothetical protein